MPQQTDAAARMRLQDIGDTIHGQKLRVAGRVLAYDAGTARIVLAGRTQGALLVDVALCLDARAPRWAAERLAVVMVVGHLECCEGPLALPALPARCPAALVPSAARVLRAVLVVDAPDLDLALWDDVLAEEVAADDGGEGR